MLLLNALCVFFYFFNSSSTMLRISICYYIYIWIMNTQILINIILCKWNFIWSLIGDIMSRTLHTNPRLRFDSWTNVNFVHFAPKWTLPDAFHSFKAILFTFRLSATALCVSTQMNTENKRKTFALLSVAVNASILLCHSNHRNIVRFFLFIQ